MPKIQCPAIFIIHFWPCFFSSDKTWKITIVPKRILRGRGIDIVFCVGSSEIFLPGHSLCAEANGVCHHMWPGGWVVFRVPEFFQGDSFAAI
ncbi:hypothetical protein [Simplicispira sp. 125]|uniref:hypothetical protein n=1 Tax=unclassified Simplicispira TaxID=2630407 RepID=UPI00325FCE2D